MHKKIVKNTLFQTLAKIFSSGTGFIITVLIARYFGAAGYGDYIKITSFVALFYLAIDFGINAIFLREDEKLNHFREVFYLRLIISFIVFVVANLIALVLPYNSLLGVGFSSPVKLGIFVFSFTLFFQSIIYSTSIIFQKELRYSRYAYSIIFGSCLNLILVILIIAFKGTIFQVVTSYLAGSLATAGAGLFLARRKILPVVFDYQFSKKILLSSLPLGLMLIFIWTVI
jgi:O-antigen/teichoic acid export membrane protein